MAIDSTIAYAEQTKAFWKPLVVVSIITVISIVLLLFVLNRLYRPVLTLRNLVTSLSSGDGDLTQRLEVTTNDDLDAIARGINQFIESLQSMMLDVQTATNRLTDGVKLTSTHNSKLTVFNNREFSSYPIFYQIPHVSYLSCFKNHASA